jgi:hypothetical protein
MRMRILCASFGLLIPLCCQVAFAEGTPACISACESDNSQCQQQSGLPNELDAREAMDACEETLKVCYQKCSDDHDREEKERQEKAEQQKEEQAHSPFVSFSDM